MALADGNDDDVDDAKRKSSSLSTILLVAVTVGLIYLSKLLWESPEVPKESKDTSLSHVEVAKIYYINLEESDDRRQNMDRQLEEQEKLTGVPFERIEAVKGESVDDLADELGAYIVSHIESCEWDKDCSNNGLCCLSSISPDLGRALLSDNYTCTHETAHTWFSKSGSHSSCFHMMANWASHVKALALARDEFFHLRRRDYVLIFEDDVVIPPDWLDLLHRSRFAQRKTSRVLEAILALAAGHTLHDDDDPGDFDYIRTDLDAFDVAPITTETDAILASLPDVHDDDVLANDDDDDIVFDDDDDDSVALKKKRNPLTAAVDWTDFPPTAVFSFGAGALLVKVSSLEKMLRSVRDCLDIDFALNIGTARGETRMATLAEPVFSQNVSLASSTTIQ